MAQIKSGFASGLQRILIARVAFDGYALGTVGEGATNGSTLPAYVIDTPVSCNLPLPDGTIVDFTGGDVWRTSYRYGITSMGSYEFVTSVVDSDLIALVTGTTPDNTTNQVWTMFSEDPLRVDLPQCCVIATYNFQGRDGRSIYANTIVPRAIIEPKSLQGGPSFQAAMQYSFRIIPQPSERFPYNLAFSGTQMGLAENRTPIVHIISNNPLQLCTFIGNGTLTSFTLPYRPSSSVVTLNNSPNQMTVNATLTAPSSVNTTTGVVTLSSAPSAGTIVGYLGETKFVAV